MIYGRRVALAGAMLAATAVGVGAQVPRDTMPSGVSVGSAAANGQSFVVFAVRADDQQPVQVGLSLAQADSAVTEMRAMISGAAPRRAREFRAVGGVLSLEWAGQAGGEMTFRARAGSRMAARTVGRAGADLIGRGILGAMGRTR